MFRRRIMAGGRKRVAIKRPVDMEMGIARSRRRLELRRSGVWVWRPYRFHRLLVFHRRHIDIGNSTTFFSARSHIAELASRQAHVRLVRIPVLQGWRIKLSRTFTEILSHIIPALHIGPPFLVSSFCSVAKCRIELNSPTIPSCEVGMVPSLSAVLECNETFRYGVIGSQKFNLLISRNELTLPSRQFVTPEKSGSRRAAGGAASMQMALTSSSR